MKRIYVVIGSSGEYADARQWTVRAFAQKQAADAYAVAAKALADKRLAVLTRTAADEDSWPEYQAARSRATRLDSNIGMYDDDISYSVVAVPFAAARTGTP